MEREIFLPSGGSGSGSHARQPVLSSSIREEKGADFDQGLASKFNREDKAGSGFGKGAMRETGSSSRDCPLSYTSRRSIGMRLEEHISSKIVWAVVIFVFLDFGSDMMIGRGFFSVPELKGVQLRRDCARQRLSPPPRRGCGCCSSSGQKCRD